MNRFAKKIRGKKLWKDKNGFFVRNSLISPKRRLSLVEFHQELKENKGRSIEANDTLGMGKLFEGFLDQRKEGSSIHGFRVKVELTDGWQKANPDNSVDFYAKLIITNEDSGEHIVSVIIDERYKGTMVDDGVHFPTIYKCLYQLYYNGALFVSEEWTSFKEASEPKNINA